MQDSQSRELVREHPVSFWVIALFFIAGGIFFYFRGAILPLLIGGIGIGLLLLILSTTLVVSIADGDRILVIQRTGLVKKETQLLDISEIETVFVEQSANRDRSSSATYRVVIVTNEGQLYPLRSYYSSGYQAKETTAQKLREAIGVTGTDQSPIGLIEQASQLFQEAYLGGGIPLEEMEEQETRGVRWQMQTIALGPSTVNRWFSKEFASPDQFLYLVQKLEDQESGKMVMSLMGKALMRKSLQMYGFNDEDLPNFDNAVVLSNLDRRMDKFFLGYSSDESWAQHILNAWVVRPLISWATDHPLRQSIKQPEIFSQLAVLFSPNGVYVSCLGELTDLEVEQLVDMGVEIVRVHGG